jgi:hypothetical protein
LAKSETALAQHEDVVKFSSASECCETLFGWRKSQCCKAAGGWYSRQWGKTPGGFGFESEEDHLNGCEAITPVSVRAIPVGRLSEMCARNGKFAEYLLNQIGRQLGAAQAQLAAVGPQSAEQKLASFLLSICRLCGATRGGEFDLPMRRGEMAEFLGLRLETVSRKMSEFQRRGWIRMSSLYHCCIVRRDILAELAQGGSAEDHPMMRSA